MRPQYLIKLAGIKDSVEELKPLVTNDEGQLDFQKAVDTGLSFGTGNWKGPNLKWNLLGNGYVHSMVPSTLIGAGVGGLINLLRGKSLLSGMGIGGLAGAGLGALHQYMYDTNKDYAFKNPFTKFTEWLTVPKDKNGMIDAYKLVMGKQSPYEDTTLVSYPDLRDKFYNAKGNYADTLFKGLNEWDDEGPVLNISADKLRPHHLYYPLTGLRFISSSPALRAKLLEKLQQ